MYKVRSYRGWVQGRDLAGFRVQIDKSDLFIRADKRLLSFARDSLRRQRGLLEEYIRRTPQFASALKPCAVPHSAPEIIQQMSWASFSAGVGPMAAVAGAIAEYVGRDLLKYAKEVIVENGGDIFLRSAVARRVGIFAGKSPYTGKLALQLRGQDEPLGICTSSGTVGPSLSFGRADACVVICDSAILADAWATRLGNMAGSAADIEKTVKFAKGRKEIKGIVLIIGDKIGVWGRIKLVSS